MRPSEILRESLRNIASGTAKAGWLVLAFVVLIGSLMFTELTVVASLDLRAREFHQAGASVRVLKVEYGIDVRRCDVLPSSQGIGGAGALREAAPLRISGLGGLPTPAFDVSPGFQALMGVDDTADAGVLVSEPLARRWQLRPGDSVDTDQGPMRIAAVFPYPDNDGRDTRLANAILLPSASGSAFDECWADVWPSTAAYDSLIRTSLVSGNTSANAMIMALNPTHGQYFTGGAEYKDRVSRLAALAAAVMGGAIGAVAGARRRLEYASALHAGMTPRDLLFISLGEAAGWATFAFLVTAATGTMVARFTTPVIAESMLPHLLLVPGAGAMGAITGSLLVAVLSRETKLFTYFRQRS